MEGKTKATEGKGCYYRTRRRVPGASPVPVRALPDFNGLLATVKSSQQSCSTADEETQGF